MVQGWSTFREVEGEFERIPLQEIGKLPGDAPPPSRSVLRVADFIRWPYGRRLRDPPTHGAPMIRYCAHHPIRARCMRVCDGRACRGLVLLGKLGRPPPSSWSWCRRRGRDLRAGVGE